MKRLALAVTIALTVSQTGIARAESPGEAKPWLVTLSANHGSWSSGDLDANGSQTLGFAQAAYNAVTWGASVSGTFARTSYLAAGLADRFDISTLADTDISTFYSAKMASLTLRGGIDLKIPTGKHSYTNAELGSLMVDELSQELMLLNTYGGGLNVAPHFVAVYSAKPFTFGAAARYELTGEYDPTSEAPDDNFDPADSLLALVNASWAVTDNDVAMLTFSWLSLGRDRQKGRDIFHQGDTYAAELRYFRKWDSLLSSTIGVSYKSQGKNELLTTDNYLRSEVSNSNNNAMEIYLSGVWAYSDDFNLLGLAGYKLVGANGYNEDESLYDAGLAKLYVEPGVTWIISKQTYITGKLRYTRISNKKDALSESDAVYNAINADVTFVYGF